ncbi:MAG: orange carotenoid protein N-terminal domain-containing protein [Phormidesmis sp.]
MTYTTLDSIQQPLNEFEKFDTDTKLALLWYGYLDIKENLEPNPANDVDVLGTTLFNKVNVLSEEEQLQAQRDVVEGNGTDLSKEYGALSSSGALEFWLLLAQGMEAGTIVTVPDDYSLPEETNDFVEMVKDLDFEERVNLTRNIVTGMGSK